MAFEIGEDGELTTQPINPSKETVKTVDSFEAALNEQLGEDAQASEEGEQKQADSAGKAPEQNSDGSKPDGEQQQGQAPQGAQANSAQDLKLADGTVIKAGAERRLYEQRELLKQQLSQRDNTINQLRDSNTQLRTRVQTFEQAQQVVQGYSGEDLAIAVQLHRGLKADPAGTLRLLLTEAAKNGIQIEGIGGAVNQDALLGRVEELIDSRLGNQQPSEQEIIQDAEREASEFFSRYPDAVTHDAVIARMLNADARLTLEDAYFQLKSAVIERGLDWSRPLADQVQQPSAPQQQQQQQQQQRPMPPAGRGVPQAQTVEADRISVANADASYNDIVRDAMREAGLAS